MKMVFDDDSIKKEASVIREKKKFLKKNQDYIEIIRHNPSIDLKEFSEKTGTAWSTAKYHIDEMVNAGIIIDNKESRNGRFRINPDYGIILGIALGAMEVKTIILSTNYERINPNSIQYIDFKKLLEKSFGTSRAEDENVLCFEAETSAMGREERCSAIIDAALKVFNDDTTYSLLAIGISLPGIIDKNSEEISFSPNIPKLLGKPVRSIIRDDLHAIIKKKEIELFFCHDTVAATVYEKEYLYKEKRLPEIKEEWQKFTALSTLYMGYGLSCGFICNNTLCLGAAGAIGEVGHIPISEEELNAEEQRIEDELGIKKPICFRYFDQQKRIIEEPIKQLSQEQCACGNTNCLERLIRVKVFNSNTISEFQERTSDYSLKAFADNNQYQFELLKFFLAKLFSIITTVFNPALLTLSGRVLSNIDQLKMSNNSILNRFSITAASKYCTISTGCKEIDVVALGAAIMAYRSIYQDPKYSYIISW